MGEKNAIVKKQDKKEITDIVLKRVNELEKEGDLHLPENYSAANALKSAWLTLQDVKDKNKRAALEVCEKNSVASSLLDMVVQGLNPSKKQCYFIVYGQTLTLMRSYFGSIAAAKQLSGVKNVVANCIYEEDEFDYGIDLETGARVIYKHVQKLGNVDFDKMIGAYAIVVTEGDEPNHLEVMNMNQIKAAWSQRRGADETDTHKKFKDEMAKKTVIHRACKWFVNTSDDSNALAGAFNRSTENEYQKEDDYEIIQDEVEKNANTETLDIDTKKEDDVIETVEAEIVEDEQVKFQDDEECPY